MDRISQLVANNAAWIHEATTALDIPGEFTAVLWQNAHDMPPIFPNADILGGTESEQLAAIDALAEARAGRVVAVKDAWARLDLTSRGFEPLFEADWLYRDAGPLETVPTDLTLEHIQTAEGLREFSIACNGEVLAEVYSPKLLHRPDITWIAARRAGKIVAGVTAVFAQGLNGINNLFAADKSDESHLIRAAVNAYSNVPACGYESGDSITPYLVLGFQTTGQLRVWLKRPPVQQKG
ncbi:MAG: hypothetical protein HY866_15300 [Chloroflexi bacterium]|nr:hypothetical protein [Chloroflexota bacterium]